MGGWRRWRRRPPMPVPREEVEKVAHLARLKLTPAEAVRLTGELTAILAHVASLRGLDLGAVAAGEPQSPAAAVALREDEPRPSLGRDEALYNAPAAEGGFFSVPRPFQER